MHRSEQLSPTREMYLKVLHRVAQQSGVARVRDVARRLSVSPGTVSAIVKKLQLAGLVEHDRYEFVRLTPTGSEIASCVIRRFDTIRALLIEVLGLDPGSAEADACMMEHAVSPATVSRMERLLHLVRQRRIDITALTVEQGAPGIFACAQCGAIETCRAGGKSTSVGATLEMPGGEHSDLDATREDLR